MSIGLKHENRRNVFAGRTDYATSEQFESLFKSRREPLLRLALLLTASSEKAAQSLTLALRDCTLNGSVSTDWIFLWARRAVVRNAAQLVFRKELVSHARNPDGNCHHGNSQVNSAETTRRIDIPSILKMPEFERLVFVITVLEHSSIQDCALLMGQSPKEICDAQKRAMGMSFLAEYEFNVPSEDGATEGDETWRQPFKN